MLFIAQMLIFLLIGCDNPISNKNKSGINQSQTQKTTYSSSSGNRKANVIELDSGKKVKFKIGITEPTASASGNLMERYQALGKDPGMTIALWLEAAVRAQMGQAEGWEAIGEMTIQDKTRFKDMKDWKTQPSLFYFVKNINNKNNAFRSFFVDATPENGYEIDFENLRIDVKRYAGKEGVGHKFFVETSGADMPRPISLLISSKTGYWVVKEFSSAYVDVRPPDNPDKETFE